MPWKPSNQKFERFSSLKFLKIHFERHFRSNLTRFGLSKWILRNFKLENCSNFWLNGFYCIRNSRFTAKCWGWCYGQTQCRWFELTRPYHGSLGAKSCFWSVLQRQMNQDWYKHQHKRTDVFWKPNSFLNRSIALKNTIKVPQDKFWRSRARCYISFTLTQSAAQAPQPPHQP